jgi:predicted RNA-binding Zn ribbon-like protein
MQTELQLAPGRLEHIREFVNTVEFEHGREELSSGAALGRWLSDRGLAVAGIRAGRDDLQRARELREAMRSILSAHRDGSSPPRSALDVLDRAARRAQLVLRFGPGDATTLDPQAGGVDGALGRLLAIVHEAIAQGTWTRLKACRQHTCQWAFYDHSKNRSGSWCKMEVCGNRVKARAYRSRQRQA